MHRLAIGFLCWTATLAPPVAAQSLTLTPYAGVLFTDDDLAGEGGFLELMPGPRPGIQLRFHTENAPIFGVRVGARVAERWGVEASYGYSSFGVLGEVDVPAIPEIGFPETDEELDRIRLAISDHDLHLWEGVVRYSFGGERLHPFLVGGIGGATMSSSDAIFGGFEEFDETTTDLAFVLGAGVRWDYREGFGVRLDLRDHLQRCDRPCLGDETLLHQVELSAGVEIGL